MAADGVVFGIRVMLVAMCGHIVGVCISQNESKQGEMTVLTTWHTSRRYILGILAR